jgi:hypothetical protein
VVERFLSAGVGVVAIAYSVLLFLPWTDAAGEQEFLGERTGIDASPLAWFGFAAALVLVLWELLSAAGVPRTANADSLVAFFLAATAGVLGITSVVHLKWTTSFPGSDDLAAAALVVVPMSILLLSGGVAHLLLHMLAPGRVPPR